MVNVESSHQGSSTANEFYELREAVTMTELLKLLRLRAEVFAASRYASGVEISPEGLELDEYDPRAKHYGLFANGERVVGYERIIYGDAGIIEPRIFRIVEGCPILQERVAKIPEAPTPMFEYCPFPEAMKQFYWGKRSRAAFVEGSRFATSLDRRYARLGLRILEGCLAITQLVVGATGVTACRGSLARVYRRFGAVDVPGTRPTHSLRWGEVSAYMTLRPEILPDEVRRHFEPMAEEYSLTGTIRFPAVVRSSREKRRVVALAS